MKRTLVLSLLGLLVLAGCQPDNPVNSEEGEKVTPDVLERTIQSGHLRLRTKVVDSEVEANTKVFINVMLQLGDRCWEYFLGHGFVTLNPWDWARKVAPRYSLRNPAVYEDGDIIVYMESKGSDPTGIALIGELKVDRSIKKRMDVSINFLPYGYHMVIYADTTNESSVIAWR